VKGTLTAGKELQAGDAGGVDIGDVEGGNAPSLGRVVQNKKEGKTQKDIVKAVLAERNDSAGQRAKIGSGRYQILSERGGVNLRVRRAKRLLNELRSRAEKRRTMFKKESLKKMDSVHVGIRETTGGKCIARRKKLEKKFLGNKERRNSGDIHCKSPRERKGGKIATYHRRGAFCEKIITVRRRKDVDLWRLRNQQKAEHETKGTRRTQQETRPPAEK